MWKKFKQAVWPQDEPEKYPFVTKPVVINEQNFMLRKARPDDADDFMKIQEEIYGTPTPWTSDVVESEIHNRNALYLVVAKNATVIAFIGLSMNLGKESHITNLAISPSYQKLGVGHLLLNQIFDYSRLHSYNRLSLEVDITNQEAIDLYEAFGFETLLIHKKYYYRNHHDALEMVVKL